MWEGDWTFFTDPWFNSTGENFPTHSYGFMLFLNNFPSILLVFPVNKSRCNLFMTIVLDGGRQDQLTTVWFFPTTGDLTGLKDRTRNNWFAFKILAGSADWEEIKKSACGRKTFPFSGIVQIIHGVPRMNKSFISPRAGHRRTDRWNQKAIFIPF